jgi:SAM-dependent methyltransferase
LKPGPYSSHSLLLSEFPFQGDGRRVLDIGCAAGYLSEILAERGFKVVGIDRPGTQHPATIEFIEADLDKGLPPLDGQFDYVICADVLEHLRAPWALLEQCRALMAPEGLLLGSLPNSGHAWFRWNVLTGRFPQDERGLFDRTHLHFYTWDGWVELFQRAGLGIDAVRSSGVPVGLAKPNLDGTIVGQALERMSFEAARAWKTLFAYQFIVRTRRECTQWA